MLYTGAKIVVRTVYGNSDGFEVEVGVHQGSALSPLLFVMAMEAFSSALNFSCICLTIKTSHHGPSGCDGLTLLTSKSRLAAVRQRY